jgi:ubiquinone/menaquinone biosynthesis C-methylase UbiE
VKHEHPVFSWFYEVLNAPGEWLGAGGMRSRLVSKLDGRVLEVGIGNGLNLRHYPAAARVVGIEPDPHMLRRAVPRMNGIDAAVSILCADGEMLPFRSASFDAVVSCLVLCTIPDADSALAEFRRVLKPGGNLHFVEHVRAPANWAASLQDAIDPAWARVFAGCHPNRDTRSAIERAGFRIEKMVAGAGGVFIRGRALVA